MKRVLLVISVLALPGLALAQPKDKKPAKPAPAAAGAGDTAAPPRVKNYDFDADEISGELVKPTGEFLAARTFAEHGSLIRVRPDFIREIVKSAEDM